jgi:hypothetical protein
MLPEKVTTGVFRDMTGAVGGLLTLLTALVLGLLIWTAYGVFSTQTAVVRSLATDVLQLDVALGDLTNHTPAFFRSLLRRSKKYCNRWASSYNDRFGSCVRSGEQRRINKGRRTMNKLTRRSILFWGASTVGGLLIGVAEAATGSVSLKIFSGGFIVGAGGGSGVLTFEGAQYPFNVSGMSLGATIGVSQAELLGRAYRLHVPQDIEGNYSAVGASLAVAGGAGLVQLGNARGVILRLRSRQVGFKLSLAISGLTITLK